jgi:mRNA-degrading endonuclease RelE of RelBE toxin-antitoxin system
MRYQVYLGPKIVKNLRKIPQYVQSTFTDLVRDLEEHGPMLPQWRNFSKLRNRENEYHCHLSYKWVACWRHTKETIVIEVYYVGSREEAPY